MRARIGGPLDFQNRPAFVCPTRRAFMAGVTFNSAASMWSIRTRSTRAVTTSRGRAITGQATANSSSSGVNSTQWYRKRRTNGTAAAITRLATDGDAPDATYSVSAHARSPGFGL
jgi:hypothetical protein